MSNPKPPSLNGVSEVYKARKLAERGIPPNDEAFEKLYPALFSYLTRNHVDAGSWTDPARLSVSNASGDWLLGFSLPGLGAYTEITAATFTAGLAQLDRGLSEGSLKWRFNLKREAKIRKIKKSET